MEISFAPLFLERSLLPSAKRPITLSPLLAFHFAIMLSLNLMSLKYRYQWQCINMSNLFTVRKDISLFLMMRKQTGTHNTTIIKVIKVKLSP